MNPLVRELMFWHVCIQSLLYINVLWYYILHGEGQIILFVFIGLILFLQYFSVPLRFISVFNNCNNSSCGLSNM